MSFNFSSTAFGTSGMKPATGIMPTFGATTTTTSSGFGFNQPQPVQQTTTFGTGFGSSSIGFGTGFSAQQPQGLGSTTSTNMAPLFSSTSASPFSSSFGQTSTSAVPTLFSNTFGSSGGLFGSASTNNPQSLLTGTSNITSTNNFGTQSNQQELSKDQIVVRSIYSINIFNDERDDVLKKWNLLQASWGIGKGYYSMIHPPVQYTQNNPFFRFKAITYNAIPENDNLDGIVKLIFNKKHSEIKSQQDKLKNGINSIVGNRPNVTVDITNIRALSENMTEVKICISEKHGNFTKRVPAVDLSNFLNQPQHKQQLMAAGVVNIASYVAPSKAELDEYFKNPPEGVDQQTWNAANRDNPNPKKYIPVPISGFSDLRARMLNQEYQTGLHQAFLDVVNQEITEQKTKLSASDSHIFELKQRFLEMQHRILRVLARQESARKTGIGIQPEEEILRGRLETMHSHLNVPTQFKGHINELLAHVKMIAGIRRQCSTYYRIDADVQTEILQFLKMEHNGLAQLIKIVNSDLEALKIINDGLKTIVTHT